MCVCVCVCACVWEEFPFRNVQIILNGLSFNIEQTVLMRKGVSQREESLNIDHNQFEAMLLQDVTDHAEYNIIFNFKKLGNLLHQNNYSHKK